MKRKLFVMGIALSCVVTVFLGIVAFYAVPYVKADNLITHVNRNGIENCGEADWISRQDVAALQIVPSAVLQEDVYVSFDSDLKIQLPAWGSIVLTYDLNANVQDWETWDVTDCYHQKKEITFVFSQGKWRVTAVTRVEDEGGHHA